MNDYTLSIACIFIFLHGLFCLWTTRFKIACVSSTSSKCILTQFSPWFEIHTSSMTIVQNNFHKKSHWKILCVTVSTRLPFMTLQNYNHWALAGWEERGVFNRAPTRVLDTVLTLSGSLPSRVFWLKAIITTQANCALHGVNSIEDSDCHAKRVYIVEIRFSCGQINSKL